MVFLFEILQNTIPETVWEQGVEARTRGVQKNRNRKTEPRTGRTELFFRLTEPVWKYG